MSLFVVNDNDGYSLHNFGSKKYVREGVTLRTDSSVLLRQPEVGPPKMLCFRNPLHEIDGSGDDAVLQQWDSGGGDLKIRAMMRGK